MFTWLDFVVLTFAASAVVDVWMNGSLFADWRAFLQVDPAVETTADDTEQTDDVVTDAVVTEDKLPWLMQLADRWLPNWACELLSCVFCFSYHTPWIVGMVFFLPAYLVYPHWTAFLFKLPAYSLAATRVGNIINSLLPTEAKYHR